jgi:hypothetical protein
MGGWETATLPLLPLFHHLKQQQLRLRLLWQVMLQLLVLLNWL